MICPPPTPTPIPTNIELVNMTANSGWDITIFFGILIFFVVVVIPLIIFLVTLALNKCDECRIENK